MTPPKEDAVRRQSWTKRGNKVAYFKGDQWTDLEDGALAAGYTTTKKVKGERATVPDVVGYVMHLHSKTKQGASSE